MFAQGQITIIVFSIALLLYVFELLRRHNISETLTLWWLFIIIAINLLSFRKVPLIDFSYFVGTGTPITALMLLSLFFVLVMLIYFSMKISLLTQQIKEIGQFYALLENKILANKNKSENELDR